MRRRHEAIQKRELATVTPPADGNYLGDWKKGYQVANVGTGGQFSDRPGGPVGANCFACHQLDPKELSYGTLGPASPDMARIAIMIRRSSRIPGQRCSTRRLCWPVQTCRDSVR